MDILCDAIGLTIPTTEEAENRQTPPTSAHTPRRRSDVRPTASSTSRSGPSHPCHLCGRTYERPDHLTRHLKSHENVRPHKCPHCPKSFNRADLLNRHQAGHDRDANSTRPQARIERGDRAAKACTACVESKSKCQDEKPCLRCTKRNLPCKTNQVHTQRRTQLETSETKKGSPTQTFSPTQGRAYGNEREEYSMIHSNGYSTDGNGKSALSPQPQSVRNDHTMAEHPLNLFQQGTRAQMANSYGHIDGSDNQTPVLFGQFGETSFLPFDSHFGHNFGVMSSDWQSIQEPDFGIWDIDLDSVEQAYQNSKSPAAGTVTSSQANDHPTVQKNVSKRYAAFERSPWLWTPTQKDQHIDLSKDNPLHVDEEAVPSVLTPSSPSSNTDDFSSCYISSRTRDEILGLLFTLQKPLTNVPSFPSLDLLNNILQVHFIQDSFSVHPLIHVGTFVPAKTIPHLFMSILASGAMLISKPKSVWKMGLALQELVRHGCADFYEQNNANTRNLQASQAFAMSLDLGLWSGFKRHMEISESFGQPLIVMLRRGGAFVPQKSASSFSPEKNDSEDVLETKWRLWAERESFKRLVLYLLMHDTAGSIGLQKPPLISITEIKFGLPASRSLWLAKSAAQWRDIYLSNTPSSSPLPSFLEVLQNPELLPQHSDQVDVHLTTLVVLHGFWSQIHSLVESKKFYPPNKSTHHLCLMTMHREIYRDITEFSSHLPTLTRSSAVASLLSELLMMILHASPEDLQRFAGKFGEEEARQAAEEFQTWSTTADARLAVWHAGQVFRLANRLMPTQLRGFNAIAVYYAALTLWVYGLMISNTDSAAQPPASNHRNSSVAATKNSNRSFPVVLNDEESTQAKSFRSMGEGTPGLSIHTEANADVGEEEFVSLEDTDRIISIANQIYRSNFPVKEERLPPLVENLGSLLKDLGGVTGGGTTRAVSRAGSSSGE